MINPTKTCYLHIGHPKSATSSIQSLLLHAALADNSTLPYYPLDYSDFGLNKDYSTLTKEAVYPGNAEPLLDAALDNNYKCLELIAESLACKNKKSVLLSSELLFYEQSASRLIQKALTNSGFSIVVVALLPNVYMGAVSCYSQFVKSHGYAGSFEEYIYFIQHLNMFKYEQVLASHIYSEHTRIRVKPYYGRQHGNTKGVLLDFLQLIDQEKSTDTLMSLPSLNQSPSAEEIEAMRIANCSGMPKSNPQKQLSEGIRKTSIYNNLLRHSSLYYLGKYLGMAADFINFPYWHNVDEQAVEEWKKLHVEIQYNSLNKSLMLSLLQQFFSDFKKDPLRERKSMEQSIIKLAPPQSGVRADVRMIDEYPHEGSTKFGIALHIWAIYNNEPVDRVFASYNRSIISETLSRRARPDVQHALGLATDQVGFVIILNRLQIPRGGVVEIYCDQTERGLHPPALIASVSVDAPEINSIANLKPTDKYSRPPSHLAIAGNCQVVPLRKWLSNQITDCKLSVLEQYHHINNQASINEWRQDALNAEATYRIPVRADYRSLDLDFTAIPNLRAYVNFYSKFFYPFYGYLEDRKYLNPFYGPYHDFIAICLAQSSPLRVSKFFQAVLTGGDFADSCIIQENALNACIEARRRHPLMASISELNPQLLEGLTFDHPSIDFLNAFYLTLWSHDFRCDPLQFKPLAEVCFPNTTLPIPNFIIRSLNSKRPNDFWRSIKPESLNNMISNVEYVDILERQILWYSKDCLEGCERAASSNHPIFLMAQACISSSVGEAWC